MNKKATPAQLSKKGNINLVELAERTGYTRQWLLQLFNQNRKAFQDLLFQEMEKDLEVNINNEVAAIRTASQIKKEMKSEFEAIKAEISSM